MSDAQKVYVFDTTLRDGQQCPGAGMTFKQNLQYARLARDVGVDVLEAGFPSASKLDCDIVKEICNQFVGDGQAPTVAGLCQLRSEQVDITIESLQTLVTVGKARMHVYLPVDPELMPFSLGDRANDKEGLVRDVHDFVKRAVDAGLEVEYSPEGYSRVGSNFDFCTDTIRAAIEAGARVINCPDTIGGACKLEGSSYFVESLKKHAAIIADEFPDREVIWSAHCHNDFGLAVENTINAVFDGPCRQIEGCFNGVGERAGNAALEQCVMVIREFARHRDSDNPLYTDVRFEHLQKICDFVDSYMLPRQPHWPVSGTNSAKHSSGGHTNAILKNPLAYQPFNPKDIGKEISFIFGPLSGGNHAKAIISEMGYRCDDSEKAEIAQFIKDYYSERRKGITDSELFEAYIQYRSPIVVDEFDYSRSSSKSSVKFSGKFFDQTGEIEETHEGRDSALAALKKAVDARYPGIEIRGHRSNSDGEGYDARSLSVITVSDANGGLYEGHGDDQDIEISALKAFVNAVNKAYVEKHFKLQGA